MRKLAYILSLVAVLLLTACQQQRGRNGILAEKAMTDVLYDYQMAMALASEDAKDDNLAELEYRYTHAVFTKHHITADEFRLSVAHYARDPKQFLAITEAVSKRFEQSLSAETQNVGGDAGEGSVRGDTIVIWEDREGFSLTANAVNRRSIDIPAKNLKPCDRILFGVDPAWHKGCDTKAMGVALSVTFDNDSTAVHTESVSDYTTNRGIGVSVPKGRKVKAVNVQIYQSARWGEKPQVLCLTNLALWGIKSNDPQSSGAENKRGGASSQPSSASSQPSSASSQPSSASEAQRIPAPNHPGTPPANPKLNEDIHAARAKSAAIE